MSAKKAGKTRRTKPLIVVAPAVACSSSFEYPCTECGGDAYIGMSNWSGPEGQIIGKDERLCNRCAKKRNLEWSFHATKTKPHHEKADIPFLR
jgi:hypothetical protein